jgi:hypothetical protein
MNVCVRERERGGSRVRPLSTCKHIRRVTYAHTPRTQLGQWLRSRKRTARHIVHGNTGWRRGWGGPASRFSVCTRALGRVQRPQVRLRIGSIGAHKADGRHPRIQCGRDGKAMALQDRLCLWGRAGRDRHREKMISNTVGHTLIHTHTHTYAHIRIQTHIYAYRHTVLLFLAHVGYPWYSHLFSLSRSQLCFLPLRDTVHTHRHMRTHTFLSFYCTHTHTLIDALFLTQTHTDTYGCCGECARIARLVLRRTARPVVLKDHTHGAEVRSPPPTLAHSVRHDASGCACVRKCVCVYVCACVAPYGYTYTHQHTHTVICTYTHTHTHTHTFAYTHTHSHRVCGPTGAVCLLRATAQSQSSMFVSTWPHHSSLWPTKSKRHTEV